jgi:diguanylate cyclase (GGDEF)-like protein
MGESTDDVRKEPRSTESVPPAMSFSAGPSAVRGWFRRQSTRKGGPKDGRPAKRVSTRVAQVQEQLGAAVEEMHQQRETAVALLRLARSLARSRSADEVCEEVSAVVPSVIGADRGCVMLYNQEAQTFSVRGATGWPAEIERELRALSVRPEDSAEVADFVKRPGARTYYAGSKDEFIRGLLERFDITSVAACPIVAQGSVIGMVVAATHDVYPLTMDTHLDERLHGLADQAGTALENVRLLDEVRRQAFHDELTGLPNHLLLRDRAERAAAWADRHGGRFAMLFLDIDQFKRVNESLGHASGDELLKLVGTRLADSVRASDTVARTGGDEFGVLLPEVDSVQGATMVAGKLRETFSQPFVLDGHEVFVTPSTGIAVYPDHAFTLDALFRGADAAMHGAKDKGRDAYVVYATGMTAKAYERLSIETDLHDALARGDLRVFYQPLVDIRSSRMVGVEALVRWQHPTRGFLSPDQFLPVAEETGLIVNVDMWVLHEAVSQARMWLDRGVPPLRIAVNMSNRTFRHPGLADEVNRALEQERMDPSVLEIEVSEKVTGQEPEETGRVIRELREHGVQVAIDDFGIGYSVLSRLQAMSVNRIKIDRSFIMDIAKESDEGPIVAGLISIAHNLDVEVTAEGVETWEQLAFLRRHGCDKAQGYLLGRPSPADEIPSLLRHVRDVAASEDPKSSVST